MLKSLRLRERWEEPDYSAMTSVELEERVWRGDSRPGYIRGGSDDILGSTLFRPLLDIHSVVLNPVPRPLLQQPERVWVRPRCPNKRLHGRKGTRRQWKHKNPPHWKFTGRMLDTVLVNDNTIFLSEEMAADLKRATSTRHLKDWRVDELRGVYVVVLVWERQRIVERFEETYDGRRGYTDTQRYTEEEERYAATREDAEKIVEEARRQT